MTLKIKTSSWKTSFKFIKEAYIFSEGGMCFPDGGINACMSHKCRYFTMGNALLVPIIKNIGG